MLAKQPNATKKSSKLCHLQLESLQHPVIHKGPKKSPHQSLQSFARTWVILSRPGRSAKVPMGAEAHSSSTSSSNSEKSNRAVIEARLIFMLAWIGKRRQQML